MNGCSRCDPSNAARGFELSATEVRAGILLVSQFTDPNTGELYVMDRAMVRLHDEKGAPAVSPMLCAAGYCGAAI